MTLYEALNSGKPFNKPLLCEKGRWAKSVMALLFPGVGSRSELVYVDMEGEVLCGVDVTDLTATDFYLKEDKTVLADITSIKSAKPNSTVKVRIKNRQGKTRILDIDKVSLTDDNNLLLEIELK
jgi:hypothetical protein